MLSLRLFAGASVLLASLPLFAAQIAFTGPQTIATGFQRLNGYAVGDFNGDGKPDLVFTDGYDKRVVVYLNDGKGGFSAPTITPLNVQYTLGGIAAGDVNEDGKQDILLTATGTLQTTYVLFGKGDGTFTVSGTVPGSYGCLQSKLIDLNADKHLDLACGGNPQIYAFLGDGKGNFTSKPIADQPSDGPAASLAVADFNRDDRLDLLVADFGNTTVGAPGSLQFYPGIGDGTFSTPSQNRPFPRGSGYSYPAAADFNRDGKLDVAFSLSTIAAIAFGNGDGTFQFGQTQMVYPPQGPDNPAYTGIDSVPLAVADFDGDGTSDIAVTSPLNNLLVVSLNDGTGTFTQTAGDFQSSVDANTFFVLTADLNGDGLPDIITGSYSTSNIKVFLSKLVKTTPTITLTSSATQVIPGTTVTFTAKVTGTNGVPTGNLTFADGSTSLGQVALDTNGQASFNTTSLGAGQHAITASYAGDARFNSTASTALAQSVVDFAVAVATASQTIAAGGTATYNLTLTGTAGFTGTVALSCTGLPVGYACAAATATLGAQPSAATLTVSPTAHALLRMPGPLSHFRSGVVLAMLPVGLWLAAPRRRRFIGVGLFGLAALTVASLGLAGCGGASSTTTTAPVNTYHGTTTFTINASTAVGSQPLSHQTDVTLVVQ